MLQYIFGIEQLKYLIKMYVKYVIKLLIISITKTNTISWRYNMYTQNVNGLEEQMPLWRHPLNLFLPKI